MGRLGVQDVDGRAGGGHAGAGVVGAVDHDALAGGTGHWGQKYAGHYLKFWFAILRTRQCS
jgi:hypothetical protein